MATGQEQLVVRYDGSDGYGGRAVFMDQSIRGIPVLDGGVNVRLNANGEVTAAFSRFVPSSVTLSRMPTVTLRYAQQSVEQSLINTGLARASTVRFDTSATLAYVSDEGQAPTPRLTWIFHGSYRTQNAEQHWIKFVVDATTGTLLKMQRQNFNLTRTVYSLGYRDNLNVVRWPEELRLLWNEGSPDATEPYGYAVYQSVLAPYNAWSGTPQNLYTANLVVHHPSPGMAAYLGNYYEPYLIFGQTRAQDPDAVAHEYGHGLFMPTAPGYPSVFKFWEEYFAINEFWGDMSSVMSEYHRVGSTDWNVSGLRNLANPATLNSGDWYGARRFIGTTDWVAYYNSTIYGHALYLMVNGGRHARVGQVVDTLSGATIPDISVTGIGASQAQLVMSYGLQDLAMTQTRVNAHTLKAATVNRALSMFGQHVSTEVNKAWMAVGIGANCTAPPAPPVYSLINYLCRGKYTVKWPRLPNTTYHLEAAPAGYDWGYGQTTGDGAMSQCNQDFPWRANFHMRACNGCGCSDWTADRILNYYSVCR